MPVTERFAPWCALRCNRSKSAPMRESPSEPESPRWRCCNANFTGACHAPRSISDRGGRSSSIGLSISIAPAQQAANPSGDGPIKSQQGGKEEPGSHPPLPRHTDVFVERQACGAGRAGGQPDRARQVLRAQCAARRGADHGAAARPERRTEAAHRGERAKSTRRLRRSARSRPTFCRRPRRCRSSRRREGGRSGDQRPRLHPHQRQDPAGARARTWW